MHAIAILNTSIATSDGTYSLETINLSKARQMVRNVDIISAVGHQSTAEILTTLLGITVPVNRIVFTQEAGQQALIFKLNGRPEEGEILSIEEIEEIGYSFKLLTRTA